MEQEGKRGMNGVLIERGKRRLFLSQKKYCRVLMCCVIGKDAPSYRKPNGGKPRNHVTMTATTSLWSTLSVINDCKQGMKSNLGVIDDDMKNVGSVIKINHFSVHLETEA